MFSAEGLDSWEIVAASGLVAASMLLISTLIGVLVAFIATRELKLVAKAVGSKEEVHQAERGSPSLATLPQSS